MQYSGKPDPECTFVEGYAILSPGTRDRFLCRGTIKWSDVGVNERPVSAEVAAEGDVTRRLKQKDV